MTKAARSRLQRAALLAFALLAAPAPASAQRYHVHTYTETDGLPSSTVSGMTQTADGRLWFATRSGIAAFDGVEWDTYDTNQGLPAKVQYFVASDSSGRLWSVGRPGAESVAYLEGDRWIACPPPQGRVAPAIGAVASAGDGPGWLAVAQEKAPLVVTSGDGWIEVGFEGRDRASAQALAAAGDTLLIGARDGLWVTDPLSGNEAVRVPAAGPDSVLGLAADPSGGVWIFRRDRIELLRDGRWEVRVPWVCPDRETIVRAAADGRGGAVFGTKHHVFTYHPTEGIEWLDHTNGLVSDGMNGVLIDREGRPWISCGRGVSRLEDRVFASYGRVHGLVDDEVTAILERSDGTVLLGQPGGVTFFTDRPDGFVRFGDPTLRVLDWAEDDDGFVWAATGMATAFRIGPNRELVRLGPADGLGKRTTVMHRFSDGSLWAAGEGFVAALHGGRFENLEEFADLLAGYPRRFLEASNGDRYLATSYGIGRYRNGEGWVLLHADADARNMYSMQERPGGGFWCGTAIGLFRMEDGRLTREARPFLDCPVYFLLDDDHGNTWIGTDNGVVVWDGVTGRRLSVEQGLAGRETNRSACYLGPSGRMWVGTDSGLSIHRPGFRVKNRAAPLVTLLPPLVRGEPLAPTAQGRFVTDDPRVTFPFRAVLFGK
ncbi:hypothetical protein K8I85_00230, partial [bacterium]|nr:hypothetical protein [bacterium]